MPEPMPPRKRPHKPAGAAEAQEAVDPIIVAGALKDEEVLGLLGALSAGMGYRDADTLPPDEEAEYKRIGQDLLDWVTQARVQVVLAEMAIRGEVVIRWSSQGWMFKKVTAEGGKAN